MSNLIFKNDEIDKAWCYYKRVNQALTGLFEILTMGFKQDDLFFQCGVDNLKQLKEVILDLLTNNYNPSEIKRKLKDLEFDMKKNLFFSDNQDKDQSKVEKEKKEKQLERKN